MPLCYPAVRLLPMKFPRLIRLLTSLSLLGATPFAQAVNFGGLNVTPRGAQNLNLDTGATDLPSGGTATDSKSGLVLTGSKMQLKPNESLTAQGATVKTKHGGTLNAGNVVYDLKNGTVTASGNVTYSDARVKNLTAPSMVVYVKSGFIVASGGIKASKPELSGATLVFDPNTMQSVVSGPFSLKAMHGSAAGQAGDRLLLNFAGNVLTGANPKPSADEVARFNPYLK